MGSKFPPLYGENEQIYVKEAKKAFDTFVTEYNKGNEEKAISALEYAQKCFEDLHNVLTKEAK